MSHMKLNFIMPAMLELASIAALAQLGERQTEDLKAPCSIHGGGIYFCLIGFIQKQMIHINNGLISSSIVVYHLFHIFCLSR